MVKGVKVGVRYFGSWLNGSRYRSDSSGHGQKGQGRGRILQVMFKGLMVGVRSFRSWSEGSR